jgi:hypothetical protein
MGFELRRVGTATSVALLCIGCQEVNVEPIQSGQALCQEYYEACINPLLTHPITVPGSNAVVTCAGEGCHNARSGAGGAFRLIAEAAAGTDDMTANYLAASSFTNLADPAMSKLLLEPLAGSSPTVGGHGGGDIFADPNDPHYRDIYFWISHPQAIATESCPSLDHYPDDPSRRCLADGPN